MKPKSLALIGNCTYHTVSKNHPPLYLDELSWRRNHRNDPEIFKAIPAVC